MDKKSEERLFRLLKRLYNAQQNVNLSDKWQENLMRKIYDIANTADFLPYSWGFPFPISKRFSIGIALAFFSGFVMLLIVQQQLNLDIVGLAFELEQDIIL